MTTAKWILCVIAASAISSYATFRLNQPNQNELGVAPSTENFSTLHSSIKHQKEDHQELAKNNAIVSDSCDKNINQTAQRLANTDADNVRQAQPASVEELQFAYEKKQNEIASFREFIQKAGNNVLGVISKNYDSEPLDPEWARSKEDELLAILDTNKTLQNTAPLELSCKSQNCRLILSAQDASQSESLYSAFKDEVLQGSDENKNQVISYFKNPDSGEIHIYLSKSTVSTLLDRKLD